MLPPSFWLSIACVALANGCTGTPRGPGGPVAAPSPTASATAPAPASVAGPAATPRGGVTGAESPDGEPPPAAPGDAPSGAVPPREPMAALLNGLASSGTGAGCPLGDERAQLAEDPGQGNFPTPACQRLAQELARHRPPIELCGEDASGAAWAVVKTRREDARTGGCTGTWRIVRVDRAGRRASSTPEAYVGRPLGAGHVNGPPTCFGFRDLDGDGVIDAHALHREGLTDSYEEWRVRLWTVKGGAVVPYRSYRVLPAFTAGDVDDDGRLDLLVNPYARTAREPVFYFGEYPHHSALGWALLAHATTDGEFSQTDEVARRFARALCPSPPAELAADDRGWVPALHCARLWGASAAQLVAMVERVCARTDLPESTAKYTCESAHEFARVIGSQQLPLTLYGE